MYYEAEFKSKFGRFSLSYEIQYPKKLTRSWRITSVALIDIDIQHSPHALVIS